MVVGYWSVVVSVFNVMISKYRQRSSACLLSLRPLGLVPASGLLWLLSKSSKLILIDNAALVTAPKKGPSAGTGVGHRLLMPLLVAVGPV
jgi:hypothetical protein